MDAFVALTENSETNIMASLVAKNQGVRKTIALVENVEEFGAHVVERQPQHERTADDPIGDHQKNRHTQHEEKCDADRNQRDDRPVRHQVSPPITACRISGCPAR